MYECETAKGDIYKFELVVEEIDIELVCDEATAKNFNVLVGEDIEFTCGEESTELDDQIQWEKLGGVTKLDKKLYFYNFIIFIYIFFPSSEPTSVTPKRSKQTFHKWAQKRRCRLVSLPERLR